ncbi:hypothetical protein [Algoriphagus zhangzhouensis]|uniref:Extracellular endo-alpha-(1->5)-L-arabinanase C-terminal domain-containing protein n=1 Tax=Algoriphagus zhangzhouensis TaxID=1073327 RepID=A0A1M7Z5E4_9BACT|nr:hypothetical protein [Algoriphagus zhangzhouensis]TDY48816.1 hypothetical protein A8938_0505 [Algoriphagus zhangzhouensis]SHO60000.1 hypothetical protein SAMN04488108_0505 [Algoriphagus zhangzhouensis]
MKLKNYTFLFSLVLIFSLMSFQLPSNVEESFDGKWEVLVKDTPQGNATIPMRFETVDGATKGYFLETPDGEEKAMTSVSIKEGKLTAYFTITGYDVYISLQKIDDDNASGSLMDMFPAEGKRVK